MRTTLVIPDSLYRRAKGAARAQGRTLSDVVAEAMAIQLAGSTGDAAPTGELFKITPVSMGVPQVDINDREALLRRMEEGD